MSNFIVDTPMMIDVLNKRSPIKMWTRGVELGQPSEIEGVEDGALKQLRNVASLPFIHKHVAAMPDVHWGMGATVGSVIATKGAIIPAAVGVDIGCGMMAVRTSLTASDLPDNLHALRTELERVIPHGRTNNGGPGDRGAWHDIPAGIRTAFGSYPYQGRAADVLHYAFERGLASRQPDLLKGRNAWTAERAMRHLGTLGTGNHFVEVCLDEEQRVWIMLHSGSRGIGNRIGTYFIEKAKEDMRRFFINLPDEDLAYIPDGSDLFNDYVFAVNWAQDYAKLNREIMMRAALTALSNKVLYGPRELMVEELAINCHHNYVSRENHYGANVLVTRKGAVRAREGELGIIPGSMGAKSFIVRGKGNPESFTSCSHGAGRKMSRTAAEKAFTLEDHAAAMKGIEARLDKGVLDETPGAYKSIDQVMAAQSDLVEIVHTLRQVVVVKG